MKLTKTHVNIFLIIFVCSLYLYVVFFSKSYLESHLGKESGFFSMLFFTFNHALYAESNYLNYRINTDSWMYKFEDGWTDYFEPYEINHHIQIFHVNKSYPNVLTDYSISEYKRIIPLIYRYNQTTKDYIRNIKSQLNLTDGAYDSIFVRRGDKIISGESEYNGPEKHIDLLVSKNPSCKVVYVQTDDYGVIEEMQVHISKKQIQLEVKTMCKESQRGTIVFSNYKEMDNYKSKDTDYIKKNKEALLATKSVDEMNPSEIYDHTLTMIAGLELVCKSNICILDYESNVGRFIKLFHNNPANVFNLLDPTNDIDYKKMICPAFSF